MRDRYGLDFEDDGASFRQRRVNQLARQMRSAAARNTPAYRLIRAMLWPVWITGTAFVLAVLVAIGTAIWEHL